MQSGLGVSLFLHGSLFLLAFFWAAHASSPKPAGGSGVINDVFLEQGSGDEESAGISVGEESEPRSSVSSHQEVLPALRAAVSKKKKEAASPSSVSRKEGEGGPSRIPAEGIGAGYGSGIGIRTGAGVGDVEMAYYFAKIRGMIQKNLRTPKNMGRVYGKATVRFFVSDQGKIDSESIELKDSSGDRRLDAAVVEAIKSLKSVPVSKIGAMVIEIPVVFR